MTQEQKQILLRDLCARLPYGVMYETSYGPRVLNDIFIYSNGPVYTDHGVGNYNEVFGVEIEYIKPYLRPMSSMTRSERIIYEELSLYHEEFGEYVPTLETFDWLNKNHFDYRIDPSTGKTLIESNLAIEAPEGMYKNE